MAYNNKMADSMMQYSSDAFKNMYDIYLDWPSSQENLASSAGEIVSVRAKGIKIPDVGVATYDRSYHGNKITLPKPEQEFERQVEITFTMDSGFVYYRNFCEWLSAVVDATNGGTANWPTLLGNLYVVPLKGTFLPLPFTNTENTYKFTPSADGSISNPAYINGTDGEKQSGAIKADPNDTEKLGWKFSNCWVSKVTAPDFAVDSSDPLEYIVTFKFVDFDAPGFGGFRKTQKDVQPSTNASTE